MFPLLCGKTMREDMEKDIPEELALMVSFLLKTVQDARSDAEELKKRIANQKNRIVQLETELRQVRSDYQRRASDLRAMINGGNEREAKLQEKLESKKKSRLTRAKQKRNS